MIVIITYAVSLILTVFLHEFAHVLAIRHYGSKSAFGIKTKKWLFFPHGKIIPFITPIEGEDFYWNLFAKNEKKAWIYQTVICGSGLITTLICSIICFCIPNNVGLQMTGFVNIMTLFVNFIGKHSDGNKLIVALKHRENYVKYLKEINFKFTPEEFEDEVKRIQLKYQKG